MFINLNHRFIFLYVRTSNLLFTLYSSFVLFLHIVFSFYSSFTVYSDFPLLCFYLLLLSILEMIILFLFSEVRSISCTLLSLLFKDENKFLYLITLNNLLYFKQYYNWRIFIILKKKKMKYILHLYILIYILNKDWNIKQLGFRTSILHQFLKYFPIIYETK